jgi:hypothetical protein
VARIKMTPVFHLHRIRAGGGAHGGPNLLKISESAFCVGLRDAACHIPGRRIIRTIEKVRAPVHAGGFFFHRGGISAERLAMSMLRYTLACMTVATATAQMISNSTFDLRAYIL